MGAAIVACMARQNQVTTYEQLQAMSPAERREHFRASIVLDPADYRPNERALVEHLNAAGVAREGRLRGQAS